MIHADAALARRLEAFMTRECRELGTIAGSLWPEKHAAVMEVAGGVALWVGAGGVVNAAVGMAMASPIEEHELRGVEDFYTSRDAAPVLTTCAFADTALFPLLARRCWRLTECENVLAMPTLAAGLLPAAPPSGIELRICRTPEERALFGAVAARGFSDDADPGPAHLEFGEIIAAHKEHVLVLAWAGGKPAGTGSVKIDQDIAWLSADSTLPEFRRQGVQQAIQRYRLDLAREAGCSLVVTEAAPGSGSQRNMERLGFHVMYTHLHFAKV